MLVPGQLSSKAVQKRFAGVLTIFVEAKRFRGTLAEVPYIKERISLPQTHPGHIPCARPGGVHNA
jgi:hypothetical protein